MSPAGPGRGTGRITLSSSSGLSGIIHSTKRAISVVNQIKMNVLATLKIVCAFAICRGASAASRCVPDKSEYVGRRNHAVTRFGQLVDEREPEQYAGDVEQHMRNGRTQRLARLADGREQMPSRRFRCWPRTPVRYPPASVMKPWPGQHNHNGRCRRRGLNSCAVKCRRHQNPDKRVPHRRSSSRGTAGTSAMAPSPRS